MWSPISSATRIRLTEYVHRSHIASMIKRWSRKHDACLHCGRTARRHVGRGLCKNCWEREWAINNSEHLKSYKHTWYLKNGGKAASKIQREQRHYDGKREWVLKRDHHKCRLCDATNQLTVHHKDGNGRGKKSPNNNPDNLITVCRKCHMEIHRKELQAARGFVGAGSWSPKFGLDSCKSCHRSDRKHNAGGLCWSCYHRTRAK